MGSSTTGYRRIAAVLAVALAMGLASYILATASDGYQAVYGLAEADPAFTGSERARGPHDRRQAVVRLPGPDAHRGAHDKRGARSVPMLQRIDVVRLRK
jgi:hypothetical protein